MIQCTFEDGVTVSLRHATVDVIVIKDGRVLLVKRNAKLVGGGLWGLTGGYMNRDETLAQCGAREVLEESGWTVTNLRLLTIRDAPNRRGDVSGRQNIDFTFIGDGVKKVGEPDWESDEVKWFGLDDLPPRRQIAFDHADIIDLYKRHLKEKLVLPVLTWDQVPL